MDFIKDNDSETIWVIKDQHGNFVNGNSIIKSDTGCWIYIPNKTFSPDARGYKTRKQAEAVIEKLNRKKTAAKFNIIFSIEKVSLIELINEHKMVKEQIIQKYC